METTFTKTQHNYSNIAYYKFVDIADPQSLRDVLLNLCNSLSIKGTIILAHEGINSCLVGKDENIDKFIEFMHNHELFSDVEFKKSVSDHIPFRRMLVKVKNEIIPMGLPSIDPARFTGNYVKALELKKWLDEGEDLVILDTRNDYEVELGTFRNAIDPKLKKFRDFPQWIKDNFAEYKNKKVITFCTGGIRCEKATAFMKQEGFKDVYQIQGGILKYFEETMNNAPNQDNHYDGDCFVFDYRVAVDKNLHETQYEICYSCWKPLSQEDLQSKLYKENEFCPHCFDNYNNKELQRENVMRENNMRALQIRQERSRQVREKRNSLSL
ncbi:rhodanese-related sulfurtransferase [Spirobacillus cienkowskii]|uniref:oxygen-dependent tRNA uridine(34) hydroxylase TrhO n=1 Tax=Spirobacillus cienkowskii TaxID=495820 RepID=UPI0030CE275B